MKRTLVTKDRTKNDIITGLGTLLASDIQFEDQFTRFGHVAVRGTHPFAILQGSYISGTKKMPQLFPSVSVAIVTENSRQQNFMGRQHVQPGYFTQAVLDEYKNLAIKDRLVSDELLTLLQEKLDASVELQYEIFNQLYTGNIMFSIWSDNKDISESLYDIVKAFVETHADEIFISNGWEEMTWTADHDGLYNFDFGRILYGSSISLTGTNCTKHLRVELEPAEKFDSIETPIKGFNADDGTEYNVRGQ